jgi:hypothetical protein
MFLREHYSAFAGSETILSLEVWLGGLTNNGVGENSRQRTSDWHRAPLGSPGAPADNGDEN